MKKSRFYRVGSALLAAAMVFTCMPQTGLYVLAQEVPADTDDGKLSTLTEPFEEEMDPQPGDDISDDQPYNKKGDDDPAVDETENDGGEETDPQNPEENQGGDSGSQPGNASEEETGNDVSDDSGQETPGAADGMVFAAPEGRDAEDTPKQEFSLDFNTRTVATKDKTYDGKKHSIDGYVLWTPQDAAVTLTLKLTGEKLHDYYPGQSGEKTKTVPLSYANAATGFAAAYEEIAPTECGKYKLEVSAAPIEPDKYEFEEKKETFTFSILPLRESETKLSGVTGVTDKEYDGRPVNLVQCIKNAKVQTDKGVDITKKVTLEFCVKWKTEDGTEHSQTIAADTADDLLPVNAGSYTLCANLVEDNSHNYVEKKWDFPFVIKRRAVTVAVNDQEMHVKKGDPIEAGTALSQDGFKKELYKLDGIVDGEKDAFMEHLTVNVQQTVDPTQTGVYDLEAEGIGAEDWPNYDITYTEGKLTVKARFKRVDNGGVLKAVTNVPNGLTLAEIVEKYLSQRTAVIYLADNTADEEYKDSVSSNDIKTTAKIEWDTERTAPGTSYRDTEKGEQKFKMQGKVILPELVYTDDEAKLTVTVEVSVREAYDGQALRPYADVPAGKVAPQTSVRLFTDEEGAQIYYTVDASDPRTSQTKRLYNQAIEINRTMTIRAVSYVRGKRDSEDLRVTYYLDISLKPTNPDDPDDPDNQTVPDKDVPKDENGRPMEIPKDMWVTDIEKYTYTGKAIKPEVRVYDYKKRLEEKKDYTISYKNNVNAADKNAVKAPTIVITGKGNYEGKLNKTFTIEPKNITDADVKTDDLTVAFNNKQQKPAPTITWNGKKLAGNKDYRVAAEAQKEAGSYPVTLTGMGNYTGERKITFMITEGTPVPKLTVSKIPAYTYTGKKIMPEPIVKSGKEVLEKGRDYTLEYGSDEENTEVGTGYVIIKGTGAEGKSKYFGVKRVTFQIKAAAMMNKAKVQFTDAAVYTGSAVEPACTVEITFKENGVNVTRTLVKGTDYTVTYQNNVKAGTATAVFEGKGFYGGTLKKTYKITAYDLLADPNRKVDIQMLEAYPYMKGGSTPKPVVRFNGKKLTEGTDYTLSYKSNKTAGSIANITVKGKGNFKGSAVKTYRVDARDISKEVQGVSDSKIVVSAADKVYQAKANIYKTKIQVLDMNGKALGAGSDYDKNVVYTYAEYINVETTNPSAAPADKIRKAGDPVGATDIIPAGAVIRVTVSAKGSNYQGTATGTYRITRADVAKAKVTVPQQTYTGKAIEPRASDIMVTLNGMVLSPEDYKVVGYTNNINKGTAKLTIQGNGNYGGTKTVTFKIKGKSLLSQIWG